MRNSIAALFACIVAAVWAPCPAHATYILTVSQVGDDVLMSGVGMLDTASMMIDPPDALVYERESFLQPALGRMRIGQDRSVLAPYVASAQKARPAFPRGEFPLGPGPSLRTPTFLPTFNSGDALAFDFALGMIQVPWGYESGEFLESYSVYAGQTLRSLGLLPGVYELMLDNNKTSDTVYFNVVAPVEQVAVPEAGSLMLLGTALLGCGALLRRGARSGQC